MSEIKTILLVEDDPQRRRPIEALLREAGHRVTATGRQAALRDFLPAGRYDAVMAAVDWSGRDPAAEVRALRAVAGGAPILVLTPPENVEEAAGILRHGADDYVLQPPRRQELAVRLGRLLERFDLDSRIAFFQNELTKRSASKSLEARSPAMRRVLDRVLRVAPMRSTVLVNGESGVGKELVARSIHFNSPRRNGPFMALNCAAIPASLIESELFGHERGAFTGAHARVKGKFEIADGGTLFLDEIAEMTPATQAKLLRVLEEREFMRVGGDRSIRVDVRVIAATNADLANLVRDGRFRSDLFYRLKVVTIDVPPLRERRPDLPALVATFLSELARANAVRPKTITPAALAVLQAYQWPGNVRELKNLVESLLVSVTGDSITPEDLPAAVRQEAPPSEIPELAPGTTLESAERELIRRTLEYTGGNRTHAADLLGIGVRTLQRKIQSYGIEVAPRRRRRRVQRGTTST